MSTKQIPVRHFTSIDSTNLEARRLVEQGVDGPLWILADKQTAGRGRLGRTWTSVTGNLYSTFLFEPRCKPEAVPHLSFVTALAVANAIDAIASQPRVRLKWPNDCLVDGAKIAGILCEVLDRGHVAIGCGINVAAAPVMSAYPATTIDAIVGKAVPVDQVFKIYVETLGASLETWRAGAGFASIAEQWRNRAIGIGETVNLSREQGSITGVMSGIAPDGALLLQLPDQSMRRIYAGDLHIPSLAAMRNS